MEKLCRNNGLTGPALNNDTSLRQLNNFTFNITDFDFVTNPTLLTGVLGTDDIGRHIFGTKAEGQGNASQQNGDGGNNEIAQKADV